MDESCNKKSVLAKLCRSVAVVVIAIAALVAATASAGPLTLRMPAYSDGAHLFFYDLLLSAFEQCQKEVVIESVTDFPHLREREMLGSGELSALWLMRTEERDRKFIPVPVGLTNGMIGERVLLVSPRHVDMFKDVRSLDDFLRLGKVGAFGRGWFDVDVWEANSMPCVTLADWRLIYGMVATGDRGIDYFSRGVNEVVKEAELHPELAIEPHLLLAYETDYILYVSPGRPELGPVLEEVLKKARDSGLIDRVVQRHWGKNFELLKLGRRTVLRLKTPVR